MVEEGFKKVITEDGVTFHIRHATETDIANVTEVHRYNTGQNKPDYWHETYLNYHSSRSGFFYVCEIEGRFAGFIIGETRAWEFGSEPCGWIYTIGVDPEARLKKVGTHLFETVCSEFKKANVHQVRTMLHHKDNLNLSFFRSQGMMGGPYIELEMELDEEA